MEKHIYIVGAHSRAQTLAVYLQALYPGLVVEAYLYNNAESNPEKIGNTPVVCLADNSQLNIHYPVYLGTRSVYHKKLAAALEEFGFTQIIPVNVELDLKLRNAFLRQYFTNMGRNFLKIDDLAVLEKDSCLEKMGATVYVTKSIFDKPLQQEYQLASYEKEIQVGAELVTQPLQAGVIQDNTGEHISDRNEQFCELTALYWMWKQAEEDLLGLVHYRRHFILPKDWAERMQELKIDVILPVPLYVTPNVEENFKKRHEPLDWEYMLNCLKQTDERMYKAAKDFFQGNLYSPCNMFIMRRTVLEDLCEWLFPILFQIAEHGGIRKERYKNRYPAFLSERMITFFFEYYREKYRMIYADKNFLI